MCQHRHSPLIWGWGGLWLVSWVGLLDGSSWDTVLNHLSEAGLRVSASTGQGGWNLLMGQVSEGRQQALAPGIRQAWSRDRVFTQGRSRKLWTERARDEEGRAGEPRPEDPQPRWSQRSEPTGPVQLSSMADPQVTLPLRGREQRAPLETPGFSVWAPRSSSQGEEASWTTEACFLFTHTHRALSTYQASCQMRDPTQSEMHSALSLMGLHVMGTVWREL